MILALTPQRAVGFTIAFIVAVGFVVWLLVNLRQARKEVGSEIELAANRRPYLDDAELETTKLDRALGLGLLLMTVVALSVPIYWLAEPGRQDGAVDHFQEVFTARGLNIYENVAQCVSCHGGAGVGGAALARSITDDDGQFIAQVDWAAPALDTVLYRFSEEEVRDILNYGRPGTPMTPWGTPGGGPLSPQQVDNVIDYLWSIQLEPEEVQAQIDAHVQDADDGLYERMLQVRSGERDALSEADAVLLGEILFWSENAGGAWNCSRCHVAGASYGRTGAPFDDEPYGAMAPSLNQVTTRLTEAQHIALVTTGTEFGLKYGSRGLGTGRMPGFGSFPNFGLATTPERFADLESGMFSEEQIAAIVAYERTIPDLGEGEVLRSEYGGSAALAPDAASGTEPDDGDDEEGES